ncbi:MAG: cobalamin biosynthesis protein, partial [Gallionella sp.]
MMQIEEYMHGLSIPLTVLAAVSLDRLLGEPRRFHPLSGFGNLAKRVEGIVYGGAELSPTSRYLRGIVAVCALLIPLAAIAAWLQQLAIFGMLFSILLLYFAIAPRSLGEHAGRVAEAFAAGDLPAARQAVGMLVSRDTSQLDEEGVSRATVESVL